ncbi:MAG: DNA mismatch repair protein MutL [Desulfuromonas sp.]|nr:MAG: DNA mismatch repair protein MutL [Desulfuromonas sp.]
MQQIRILPENLCNKIAAGEVVERPASVVKELVENAIDAGADEVLVDIEAGGKKMIRIQDNGCGMSKDDTFLALERHATSKIASDDDLFRLTTLGFRGEALPSIAAVSRLLLQSRDQQSDSGWRIKVSGGKVEQAEATGMPVGTSVEVRNLFFNTPARRKFLRRDQTEIGHIGDVVSRQALARPEIRFRLAHNGRVLIDALKTEKIEERVAAILGREAVREMVPATCERHDLALHGLLSRPLYNRSATSAIYTYINGRFIRDRVVQHAVLDGYRNLMLKGRYPVVVLFLDLPPDQVDVNVHPTKHEVRFREQSRVHDFIASAVREALRPSVSSSETRDVDDEAVDQQAPPFEPGVEKVDKVDPRPSRPLFEPSAVKEPQADYSLPLSPAPKERQTTEPYRTEPKRPTPFPLPSDAAADGSFGRMQVIGQFRESYLVCQDGDSLVLIDQHAAHERVGFERLRQQFYGDGIEKQSLLFPVVLEFDFREATELKQRAERFSSLGFDIEEFGGNSFVLKAVPQLLKDSEAEKLVRDVASELSELGESSRVEDTFDHLLATMACHSVIRANQKLGLDQMRALLQALDTVDFGAHCPHGRPVMQRLSLVEIERMFRRG